MIKDKTFDHESILTIYTTVDLQKQIEHLIEITGKALCESYDEVDRLRTKATENAQRTWRLEKGLTELLQKQVGRGTKNAGFWGSFKPLQRYSIYPFQICYCSRFVLQNTVPYGTPQYF